MPAKYRVGDRVQIKDTVLPGSPKGNVILAFLYKQFALPDQQHYNVKLDDGIVFEVDEDELNGNIRSAS